MSVLDIKSCLVSFDIAGGVLSEVVVPGVNDARTGVAFDPSLVIFIPNSGGFYDDPPRQHIFNNLGLDDGTTAIGYSTGSQWAFGTSWRSHATYTNASLIKSFGYPNATVCARGRITSKAVGQFSYTMSVATFGFGFTALCIGGADFKHHFLVNPIATAGSHTTTGCLFQPTGGIFIPNSNAGVGNGDSSPPSIGFFGTDLSQAAVATAFSSAEAPDNDAYSYQRTNAALVSVNAVTGVGSIALTVTAITSDGITYTSAGVSFSGVLLGGIDFAVGSFDQPATNGETIIPNSNTQLGFGVFASFMHQASSAIQANATFALGLAVADNQAQYWQSTLQGATDTARGGEVKAGIGETLFFAAPINGTSSDSTPIGTMTSNLSFSGGYKGTWTETDGTQRQIIYFLGLVELDLAPLSGIYKLVPDKINDTLYTSFDPVTTEDVKIP